MKSLLASAMRRTQIARRGEIVELVFDGQGALVTFTLTWRMAERWATARTPSGNLVTDRGKLIARLDTLLVRRGTSIASSEGNIKALLSLIKAMEQVGMDASEWQLPSKVKEALEPDAEDEDAEGTESDAETDVPWYEQTQQIDKNAEPTRREPEVRKQIARTDRDKIDRLLGRD